MQRSLVSEPPNPDDDLPSQLVQPLPRRTIKKLLLHAVLGPHRLEGLRQGVTSPLHAARAHPVQAHRARPLMARERPASDVSQISHHPLLADQHPEVPLLRTARRAKASRGIMRPAAQPPETQPPETAQRAISKCATSRPATVRRARVLTAKGLPVRALVAERRGAARGDERVDRVTPARREQQVRRKKRLTALQRDARDVRPRRVGHLGQNANHRLGPPSRVERRLSDLGTRTIGQLGLTRLLSGYRRAIPLVTTPRLRFHQLPVHLQPGPQWLPGGLPHASSPPKKRPTDLLSSTLVQLHSSPFMRRAIDSRRPCRLA